MNVSPERILNINWDYTKTRVLASSVELDIFTLIAKGKRTVKTLSKAAHSSQRGIAMLLNALTGLGLLVKNKNNTFNLTPEAGEFLVQGKPRYLGGMSLHTLELNRIWLNLTECIRTGKPYSNVDDEKGAKDYFPALVRALFQMNYPSAKYAAIYLKKKQKNLSTILDVAAGSGVWGIAFQEEFKTAKVIALDFPEILNVTREYAARFKMKNRYEYLSGDLRDMNLGKDCYDLIILGHICHSEGRVHTRELLKKSFHALKKDGLLLIADFLLYNNKTGPLIPLLFALNMLVNTNEGDVFTIGEIKDLLFCTGFKHIETLKKAPSISPLILATK